mgnify:CR=1 FL=1
MSRDLTDLETISYNGFVFPIYSQSKISARPVYDAAKRTVQFIEFTVVVDFHLIAENAGAGNTTDAEMDTIRKRLTQRGGALKIKNNGFGGLDTRLAFNSPLHVRHIENLANMAKSGLFVDRKSVV